MPLRNRLQRQCVFDFDVPILPFLAPRVFAPWPKFRLRRGLAAEARRSNHNAIHEPTLSEPISSNVRESDKIRGRDADLAAMARIVQAMDTGSFQTAARQRANNWYYEPNFAAPPIDQVGSWTAYSSRRREMKTAFQPNQEDDSRSNYAEHTRGFQKPSRQRSSASTSKPPRAAATASTDPRMRFDSSKGSWSMQQGHFTWRSIPLPDSPTARSSNGGRVRRGRALSKAQVENGISQDNYIARDYTKYHKSSLPPSGVRRAAWIVRLRKTVDQLRVPYVRTHWQSIRPLASGTAWSSARTWSTEYSKLAMLSDSRLQHKVWELQKYPILRKQKWPRDVKYAAYQLAKAKDVGEVRSHWQQLQRDPRHKSKRLVKWADMMLETLNIFPNSALKVLIGSYDPASVPSYAAADCLEHIVKYYLHRKEDSGRASNVAILLKSIESMRIQEVTEPRFLTQATIQLLASHLNGDQLKSFFDTLRRCNQTLHENTLLHIIHRLGTLEETETAIEALDLLRENGTDFEQAKVESVCAQVLYKNRPTSSISNSDIFAHMLSLGLQPNIIFYNLLIRGSIITGDSETAWRIHDMMIEINIHPNEYTYSILLNDAKHRVDREAIQRVYDLVQSENMNSTFVITDLLHAVFVGHEADKRNSEPTSDTPLRKMISLYRMHFDMAPLRPFVPYALKRYMDDYGIISTVPPPREALVVMLIAIIREHGTNQLYRQFQLSVLKGDPLTAPLVESTHIYDAFIMAFAADPENLSMCTSVLADMLSPTPTILGKQPKPSASDTGAAVDALVSPSCLPSVYTWSILLKAFLDNRQPRAAQKVLELMDEHGIAPTIVTWNTVAMGYARLQDVPNTVDAVKKLEAAGLKMDHVTMKALQLIRNRAALREALEHISARQLEESNAGNTDPSYNGPTARSDHRRLSELSNISSVVVPPSGDSKAEESSMRHRDRSKQRLLHQPQLIDEDSLAFPPGSQEDTFRVSDEDLPQSNNHEDAAVPQEALQPQNLFYEGHDIANILEDATGERGV